MDEPLAALDYQRKQEILPYLIRLHQMLEIPVVYVTHAQQEVAKLADHLVILREGRVLAAGPLAETLSRIDLPQTEDIQAAMIWEGRIAAHEGAYHLTRVDCDGLVLSMPQIDDVVRAPVRVQIYASDVSIALEAPSASSILNVMPATITDIAENQQGQTVLRLKVGALPLLAIISLKSKLIHAAVCHRDACELLTDFLDAQQDFTLMSKFGGIAEQVEHDLFDLILIGEN